MKKCLAFLAFLLLILLAPLRLYADLGDFQQDVEQTEDQADDSDEIANGDQDSDEDNDDEYSDEDDDGSIIGQILFEIFKFVWVLNNTTTTYGAYPYSPTGYISWAEPADDYYGLDYVTTGYRSSWFALDSEAIYLDGLGFGSWATLRGHFYRFFGPYLDSWVISDGSDLFYGLRVGGSLSLFQSDPFSMSVFAQWVSWNGILDREGANIGVELRSFPGRPLALQYRLGYQFFGSFHMLESDAQLGILFNRFEIFGGYRWWGLLTTSGDLTSDYGGPEFGVRLHF